MDLAKMLKVGHERLVFEKHYIVQWLNPKNATGRKKCDNHKGWHMEYPVQIDGILPKWTQQFSYVALHSEFVKYSLNYGYLKSIILVLLETRKWQMCTWCSHGFYKDIRKSLTRYTPMTFVPLERRPKFLCSFTRTTRCPPSSPPRLLQYAPWYILGSFPFSQRSMFVPTLGPGDKIFFFHLESPFPIPIGQISPSHSALTYTVTSSEKAFLDTHPKNPLLPRVPAKTYSLSYLFGWFSSQHLTLLDSYFVYSLLYYLSPPVELNFTRSGTMSLLVNTIFHLN